MSEKENAAITTLKKHNGKLSTALQALLLQNSQIIKNKETIKSEINAKFNNLINIISNKQEMILKQLDKETAKLQSEIKKKSQILTQKQTATTKAILTCNDTLKSNDSINHKIVKMRLYHYLMIIERIQ